MAEITAALVKELRDRTGAGMMDCKKALAENNGDIEASIDWLRTKGLAAAAKKAGRVAAEGLVGVAADGTKGAVVEVNSETDFVAKNEQFQAFVRDVTQVALAEGITNIVTEFKGQVHKTETWGLKQLAYKIAKNRKGHYAMLSVEAPGEAVAEIERQAAINEDIIRWMTIKVDELEKGPSVMMRKQERRGGRGRDRDGEE